MMIKRLLSVLMVCATLNLLGTAPVFANKSESSEFPGRSLYLDVKHISLEDLNANFNNVVIVDVRSSYEYQTLHIKGAINISLNSPSFVDEMLTQRNSNPGKQLVTYCNGKTCMKSYQAARKCHSRNIADVVAFDAGIMDWAKAHPDKSTLLGVSPIDPGKLISKQEFKKHLLSPEQFMNQANSSQSIVVDVRDPLQRDGLALFMGKEKRASLANQKELEKHVSLAKSKNIPLLVYDEAGKQVEWLMYYLEDMGISHYYFMEGGAKAFYKDVRNDFMKADNK